MNILRTLDALKAVPGPLVIAAGVFDGMHLGHRAVLQAALDAAAPLGGAAAALTFDPHPSRVLRPDRASRLLTSTPHKLALMKAFGIEHVLVISFDRAFADIEAPDFLRRLCAAAPHLRRICVGAGWRFGKDRAGDGLLLRSLGPELGFETTEVSPVMAGNLTVSSTLIREAIKQGDLATAASLLGRRFSILGTVQHGDGLGSKIGFPTANLAVQNEQFPPNGVYAVRVRAGAVERPGVANIGVRPTVKTSGDRLLEVHLPGFQGDLYGREIEAEFLRFLRPEKKFPDLDSLRSQIALDTAAALASEG